MPKLKINKRMIPICVKMPKEMVADIDGARAKVEWTRGKWIRKAVENQIKKIKRGGKS